MHSPQSRTSRITADTACSIETVEDAIEQLGGVEDQRSVQQSIGFEVLRGLVTPVSLNAAILSARACVRSARVLQEAGVALHHTIASHPAVSLRAVTRSAKRVLDVTSTLLERGTKLLDALTQPSLAAANPEAYAAAWSSLVEVAHVCCSSLADSDAPVQHLLEQLACLGAVLPSEVSGPTGVFLSVNSGKSGGSRAAAEARQRTVSEKLRTGTNASALIQASTNVDVLSRMYPGWAAWL